MLVFNYIDISNTFILFCIFILINNTSSEISKTVRINQGLVRGFQTDDGSVIQFFGIPYATAPSGDDKFKAPLPPPKWDEVLNATRKNIICPQLKNNQVPDNSYVTFNCLHINVHVPNIENKTNLPVIMYIHGGAFKQGYGNEISPLNLVKQGVIVTNINYRVGALGFLCLRTEFAPGNAGLKDQVAALKWIKENIANFGGNPDNVSIAGNSAGAAFVEFLILSRMASGLFHKAISESGSALSSWAIDGAPIDTADYYAMEFNVTTNKNITELEYFYKSLTIDDFRMDFAMFRYDVLGFSPCLEKEISGIEAFIMETPLSVLERGDYNKVPYVTGLTSKEGIYYLQIYDNRKRNMEKDMSLYIPKDLMFSNEQEKMDVITKINAFYFSPNGINYNNYVDYWTDVSFGYALVKSAILHSGNFEELFFYIFSFDGRVRLPESESPPVSGPGHVAQAMYVQNFSYGIGYEKMKANDYLIQDRMVTMWTNFCKFGRPIGQTDDLLPTEWYTFGENENYLDIDVAMESKIKPLKERIAFWDDIYERYRRIL